MNGKLREKLINKIGSIADRPINEITLGQLLIDIRKLLEVMSKERVFPTLKLFCDWAVHSRISGSKAQKLLIEVDDLYDTCLSRSLTIQGHISPTLGNYLSFHWFKDELSRFLKICGFNAPDLLNQGPWNQLEELYCKIVSDCMLLYENRKRPLKHIDAAIVSIRKLTFTPAQLSYDPLTNPLGIEWIFFKGDKEVFRLLLTRGSKPGLPDGLHQPNLPQMPSRPPD